MNPRYEGSELREYKVLDLIEGWTEEMGGVSAPFLQRRLRISYSYAKKLIEEVDKKKVNNLVSD